MNNKVIGIIVAVIVIAAGAWLIYGRNNNSYNNSSSNSSSNNSSSNNSGSTPSSLSYQVSIANFAFSPSAISVKKGTKVTWTNNDSTAHTVTESDGKTGPDSQLINPGSSYSFTYSSTGTFNYHCTIHSTMTGTVTVTD